MEIKVGAQYISKDYLGVPMVFTCTYFSETQCRLLGSSWQNDFLFPISFVLNNFKPFVDNFDIGI